MAGGADMRGGPQQRPPALQHVRGCEEGYEAGLSVFEDCSGAGFRNNSR